MATDTFRLKKSNHVDVLTGLISGQVKAARRVQIPAPFFLWALTPPVLPSPSLTHEQDILSYLCLGS